MSKQKPVFLLLTATSCTPCTTLKQKLWPSIKQQLNKSQLVDIKHINFPSRNSNSLPKMITEVSKDTVPEQIRGLITWFPQVLLITSSAWRQALINPDYKLTESTAVKMENNTHLNINSTVNWVKDIISRPSFKIDQSNNTYAIKNNNVTEQHIPNNTNRPSDLPRQPHHRTPRSTSLSRPRMSPFFDYTTSNNNNISTKYNYNTDTNSTNSNSNNNYNTNSNNGYNTNSNSTSSYNSYNINTNTTNNSNNGYNTSTNSNSTSYASTNDMNEVSGIRVVYVPMMDRL